MREGRPGSGAVASHAGGVRGRGAREWVDSRPRRGG